MNRIRHELSKPKVVSLVLGRNIRSKNIKKYNNDGSV